MTRRLKYDIPGPDWRVELDDVRQRGLTALFAPHLAAPLRTVLDIGFGRGEFLRRLAEGAPDVAHVGVEISFKRVLKMARRLAASELVNVRLVHAPADTLLEVVAPASVETVWVNFPDPWPKKRHAGRRLLAPRFLHALAQRLVPGGRLEIATDHVAYAEEIDAGLSAESLLENALAPRPYLRDVPGRPCTAYEAEWREERRPLHFWTYLRRAEGARE